MANAVIEAVHDMRMRAEAAIDSSVDSTIESCARLVERLYAIDNQISVPELAASIRKLKEHP